jgi:hypothetical protein
MKFYRFELEGLSGMKYGTFAETIGEAFDLAKRFAHKLAESEKTDVREVVSVYLEDSYDIIEKAELERTTK